MIDRRRLMMGTGAVLTASAFAPTLMSKPVAAWEAGTLRIVSLKFGSLNWLLQTIKAEGLEKKTGVKIDILEVATNQAGPVALLANEVDLIVSDWTWAMRQRSL
jgi:NitT/TauT family transport system substrate-binding protein